jgi:signal transduction histidine kinase
MLMSYEGTDFQYIFPNHPFYANVSRFIASMATLAIMIHIMQLFCKQKKNNSRFYTISSIYKWVIFLMIPITLITYEFFPFLAVKKIHFYFFVVSQIGGLILIFISSIEKIIQKYKPAYFYLAAVCMLLYTGIEATFAEMGLIRQRAETPNQLQWCFILEVIIVLTGILYRYYIIKIENEKLEIELETQKVSSIKNVLEIQQLEQQRIAEDLHDVLGSQLATIKLKLLSLEKNENNIHQLVNLIDEVSNNTRNIAHNLLPSNLHNNAISDIINNYLLQLNKEQTIQFNFLQTGTPIEFKKDIEICIYKVIMEIIHNTLKHSKATESTIQFFFKGNSLEIVAEDNGVGIDLKNMRGMGINNISNRIKAINGNFHLESTPGNTIYILTIPI